MKFDVLIRYIIRRFDAGHSRMVIVKFPSGELARVVDGRFDFDQAGWTEVGPSELFLACPDNLDRMTSGARQARCFERGAAGVLSTVGGAGVGDDNAHA